MKTGKEMNLLLAVIVSLLMLVIYLPMDLLYFFLQYHHFVNCLASLEG